ncbi:putative 2-hydroxyacid dehydrogenase [Nostocoides japonicum T1-X7]|uniref:Putative 2-hydroxyacid dehydrogenase n=1 Tax=Nostocoides japonicum T1-X7 TaxID=1194083 RepID=A0A077M5S0_9MICO|nr:NAD(P)-dependent oxidoreductase [Tetrasphaera japonica]CCH79519.1 putative 2-hydroxyacid dehydrogenase [Tetrasphaera japonica T1-X7]
MVSLGFVGLGSMGGPMCRRLAQAGYAVTAFDLDPAKLAEAVDAGAVAARSPAEAASVADIFLTSLPHPAHVETVMVQAGALGALRDGAVWVDLTTNRIELVQCLADQAPPGVRVVDSPVTGAVDGARTGRLTLFAGGDAEAVATVVPVLSRLGEVIVCGPLGSGNVVKLVTNQLWFVAAAAIGEGFAVGLRHGVALDTLWTAIRRSVGDSFVAQHDAPSIFAGHYDPSFTLDLCLKDLRLIGELQEAVSARLPLTDAARDAFATAAERYGTDAPELTVAKRIEEDADLSFRLEGTWVAPWEVTTPST